MENKVKIVIMRIEPSKRLSEILGYPYYIEKRYSTEELIKQGIINTDDIQQMGKGNEICKRIPVT